ncbi:MAG: hypothetical protein LC687_00835 [Actinobacteria bacterium]|nr:hypothetical protein [Actinomycetota bacterium]MCA1806401.1 hypothetical protein [Actinomycetota bacterium]
MKQLEGHTPGPWWYEKEDEGDRHFVACNLTECDETVICKATYGEADARLIAAAPDLLVERDRLHEALEKIAYDEGQHVPLREGGTAYRMRAIAKEALGEEE